MEGAGTGQEVGMDGGDGGGEAAMDMVEAGEGRDGAEQDDGDGDDDNDGGGGSEEEGEEDDDGNAGVEWLNTDDGYDEDMTQDSWLSNCKCKVAVNEP